MQLKFIEKIQQPLCGFWDVAASAVGAAISAKGQKDLNEQMQGYQKELMGLQHGYNEQSAEAAYQRQRELNAENWRLYNSYEAQRASMEAAGLSPALMYGMGGAGGSGAGSSAPQAQGVGLPSALLGNVGAAAVQGAQLGLMNAQTKELNAKASESNAKATEANTKAYIAKAKLPVEVRLANATAGMNETIADLNQQKFDFIESNWNDIVGYLSATTGKIYQEMQRQIMENQLYEDMKNKGMNPFITAIATQIADQNYKAAEALLAKKKIELTEAQRDKLREEIKEVTEHITLMKAQGKNITEQTNYIGKYFTKDTVLGSLTVAAELIRAIKG